MEHRSSLRPSCTPTFKRANYGAAFPTGDDTFAIGPVIGLAYPFRAEVRFVRDAQGGVSSLKWAETNSSEVIADRVEVNSEEVTYPGGDGVITLAGRLITPKSAGKHLL